MEAQEKLVPTIARCDSLTPEYLNFGIPALLLTASSFGFLVCLL
jgi:hypothetical protein